MEDIKMHTSGTELHYNTAKSVQCHSASLFQVNGKVNVMEPYNVVQLSNITSDTPNNITSDTPNIIWIRVMNMWRGCTPVQGRRRYYETESIIRQLIKTGVFLSAFIYSDSTKTLVFFKEICACVDREVQNLIGKNILIEWVPNVCSKIHQVSATTGVTVFIGRIIT